MTPDDDDVIIAAYADLARPTDPAEELMGAVRRRMRRRARRRRSVAAVVAGCVVAVVAVGTNQLVGDPSPGASGAGGGGAAPSTGALPNPDAHSCAVEYSRRTLEERDWAVDATVADIGRGRTTVTVRLDVHTWYRGGRGDSVQVRLPSPRSWVEDAPPAYEVGTRLLLSGSRSDGAPLPWSCGFTRYHDERTAALWAEVFNR